MSTIYRTTRTTTVNRLDTAPAPKRSKGRPAKPKSEPRVRFKVNIEIIGYDPATKLTDDPQGRVLIDGVVPIELALMFKSLEQAYNNGTLVFSPAHA